jgi:hypothetical protein
MQNTELSKPRKEYTGVAKRILNYLSGGATAAQTAAACGVDDSYVSQLKSEEDFQLQIAERLTKDFEAALKIDENYNKVEEVLSKRLTEVISYITNADQITRILKTVAAIPKKVQQRIPLNSETDGTAIAPVSLAIPIVAKNVFIVSPNSEVVELDGKELVTLNSRSMESLLKEKRERVIIDQAKPVLILEKPKVNGKQRIASSTDEYSDL